MSKIINTDLKDIAKAMGNKPKNVTFASRKLLPPLDLREEGQLRENAFNDILCELWGRNEKIEEAWVTKEQYRDIQRNWQFANMPNKGTSFTYRSDFGDVVIQIK